MSLQHTYQNILGFFNFQDIYLDQINKANNGYKFVEIGSLLGKSSAFMGVEIKNSGKKIQFDCVDFWDVRGVKELEKPGDQTGLCYSVDGDDILFVKFNENMKLANIDDIINTHRMSSIDASKLYEDESLDFVFIDASHEYIDVKADLEHWFQKVKWGRTIAGHDYDWAGVKQAVDEFFGAENITASGTSWIYHKPKYKYSIIISYRDREEHLQTLLPVLQDRFKRVKYEIIISEQNDAELFKQNVLYNVATLNSTGDVLIFHDVDYIPSENVNYLVNDLNTPVYPITNVIFLDKDGNELDMEQVPAGYRIFKTDASNFHGGVFTLTRPIYDKMNGLNPCFAGWGCPDVDTRERVKEAGFIWKRNPIGVFFALYHKNRDPGVNDEAEVKNRSMAYNRPLSITKGKDDFSYTLEKFESGIPNVIWLKISNIKI